MKLFTISVHSRGGWFRLGRFGPGLSVMHRSMPPLFSERYGFTKVWPSPYAWLRVAFLKRIQV